MDLKTGLRDASTAGAFCALVNARTGAPILEAETKEPVGLILAGVDSEQYAAAEVAAARRRQATAEKAGRKWRFTPEMQREEQLEILVACTLGWRNASYGGEKEFSADRVREMYRNERWIREQAEAFIADRESFAEASPTT